MADQRSIIHDWQLNPIPPAVPIANVKWHGPENLAGDAVNLVAAPNQDGHIEVVYSDEQAIIYHNWQLAPNGNWAAYPGTAPVAFASQSNQTLQAKTVAVALDGAGFLRIFFADVGDRLFSIKQAAPNKGWGRAVRMPGGVEARQIATALNVNRCLEMFYVGSNNGIYRNRQSAPGSDNWEGEVRFEGGVSANQIAVAQNQNGCLEIFYVGTNGHIYHNRQAGPNSHLWEGEVPFLQNEAKQLAVAANPDGSLEVFYIGTNDGLYRLRQASPNDYTWNGPFPFLGDSAKRIAVGRNKDGRLELFYVGTNAHLFHNWQGLPGGDDWHGEVPFNPPATATNLAVASNQDGRLEVFYFDANKEAGPLLDPGSNS